MASTVDGAERPSFLFPGFGLPLNYTPPDDSKDALFPNALDAKRMRQVSEYGLSPLTTLREFEMLNFMNEVTDKPDWDMKVFDENIISTWKQEALKDEYADITEKMVDWCIAELQYKTKSFQKTGAINAYNDVVKSDTVISGELKEALKAAVAPLEQVPERVKDWHPNSNNQVLDIVHPSLFPLIYGRSRVLRNGVVGLEDCIKRSGEGVVVPVPPEEESGYKLYTPPNAWTRNRPSTPYSTQFQWLPCDVDISGDRAKIKSYINNLHPQRHSHLYSVIEEIISRTIPLWNMTLSPLKNPNVRYKRIDYKECEYDPDPEAGPETEGPQQEEDEDEDDFLERRSEWEEATRVVVRPEPGPFAPPACGEHPNSTKMTGVDLRRDFGHRGLQVIVKLANIHLTPKNPEYQGGSWHVEGQLNEHICASAIYYYDSKNITSSKLSFRQQSAVRVDVNYAQNHHDWLEEIYGCVNEESGVQDCGTVKTPEGRLLTWPNILQHQVQPFKLEDRSKPGHRKILAFFLVDPNIRITSTATVPCQQRDWWSAEVVRDGENAMARLPVEVQDHIIQEVDEFPISMDEAKALRLKLMGERAVFVKYYDDAFHQHTFSLCEH